MLLNQTTDYGMQITLFLAKQQNGHVIGADTISSAEKIPKKSVFKIMRSLTKAGIVESVRGRAGGFVLGRNSENITLYDIIVAIEGTVVLNHCLVSSNKCNKNATECCIVHESLAKVREDLIQGFQDINIKMLLEAA